MGWLPVACASTGPDSAAAMPVLYPNDKLTSVYRSFVQRCLSEKGFEVIGWN